MKCSGQHIYTPIYLKLSDDMPWPEEEKAFYLLSRDGLFLCRNTPFFRSGVPVEEFPSELAGQKPFLKICYPRIPRRLMEQVIGLFAVIGERYGSECVALIVWNRTTQEVQISVPEQVGFVGMTSYGSPYPMDLSYEVPQLAPELVLLGDIHSHVDGLAYSSSLDKSDETHRPGLHLVVGRILDEPPQFHCEATADGVRFKVSDLSLIMEGYHRRRVDEVPAEWISKVHVKPWNLKKRCDAPSSSLSYGSSGSVEGNGRYPVYAYKDLEAKALLPEDKRDGPSAPQPPNCSGPSPAP